MSELISVTAARIVRRSTRRGSLLVTASVVPTTAKPAFSNIAHVPSAVRCGVPHRTVEHVYTDPPPEQGSSLSAFPSVRGDRQGPRCTNGAHREGVPGSWPRRSSIRSWTAAADRAGRKIPSAHSIR